LKWPPSSVAAIFIFTLSAMQGDVAATYQDFLTLWKDADPVIPILKQAKAEYAKLQ
jgi:hypothetical protein